MEEAVDISGGPVDIGGHVSDHQASGDGPVATEATEPRLGDRTEKTPGTLGTAEAPETAEVSPGRVPTWLAVGRRRSLVGWIVYAVAFGVYVAVLGIPYSEDTFLIWITAALFVASLGDVGRWRRGVLRDWLPLYAVLALYALLRGYASHVLWGPFVRPQVDFDRWIGFGVDPTVQLQRWLFNPADLRPWDYAVWTVYMSHFFVSLTVLAVLWKRNYALFRRYLALWVGLTFIGYVVYVLYPAMPPWLASQTGNLPPTTRIIPVVWDHVGVHAAAAVFTGGSRFDNNIAAMPSLHAAYPMLLALFFWKRVRPLTKALLAFYVLAMAFTLVYTGEHFVIDELVGWSLASGVYFGGSPLLDRVEVRRARRADTRLDGPAADSTERVGTDGADTDGADTDGADTDGADTDGAVVTRPFDRPWRRSVVLESDPTLG
jgi:hypothetical protein